MSSSLAKVKTKVFDKEHQQRFFNHLTEFAFKKVMTQMDPSKDVCVIDEHSVETSKGLLKVPPDPCECIRFVSLSMPSRHIIAMRNFQDLDCFVLELWQPDGPGCTIIVMSPSIQPSLL
jgi:hypothetical protein